MYSNFFIKIKKNKINKLFNYKIKSFLTKKSILLRLKLKNNKIFE